MKQLKEKEYEEFRQYQHNTEEKIIAACGNDCAACPRYTAHPYEKTDEELHHTAELWMKIGYRDHIVSNEEIACYGCKPENWCRYRVIKCCEDHGIKICGECSEYPCNNIKECFEVTKSFEPICRQVCTDDEYKRLEKAFFEKEKNLRHRRMALRDFKKEDAQIIAGWLRSEEELYKWSADRFNKYPLSGNDINENYAPQIETGRFYPLTAVDDNGDVSGHFIIRYPRDDDDSSVRFGFVIVNPAMRGKGYGKELLQLGIEYVKEHLSARRIDLGVFDNNESARHCYESVGFAEYARRECRMPMGTWNCTDMEMFI